MAADGFSSILPEKRGQAMTEVFVASHPTEAHLVAGLLVSQGIPAEIRGEALFGARGEVPPSPATLPSVWVEDSQAVEALAILKDPPSGAGLAGGVEQPWRCASCGETVEPQFTAC